MASVGDYRSHLRHSSAPPLLLLFGFFSYYLAVVLSFGGVLRIWLNAIVMSALVGVALNAAAIGTTPIKKWVQEGPWRCFRLFLVPFCVSSISAVRAANAPVFFYLLPREQGPMTRALAACLAVPLLVKGLQKCFAPTTADSATTADSGNASGDTLRVDCGRGDLTFSSSASSPISAEIESGGSR